MAAHSAKKLQDALTLLVEAYSDLWQSLSQQFDEDSEDFDSAFLAIVAESLSYVVKHQDISLEDSCAIVVTLCEAQEILADKGGKRQKPPRKHKRKER